MAGVEEAIGALGGDLWQYIVLPVVVILGIYFTVRTGVVQIRNFPDMFRTLRDPTPVGADGEPQSISSFQAFTVSAASRVGVGNIAGVGTAIVTGGPGAVFWMWLMAAIGAASAFVESTLGQLYKVREKDSFRGGPAYYMQYGLGQRWMGILFACILIACFPFAFSSLQANTIVATVTASTGSEASWLPLVVGLALAALTGLVVFGGIRRIATVTDKLVPAMALLYLLLGLAIVAINIDQVPWAVGSIVRDAFTPNAVTGGALGTVILIGVQRGMFSNEAGLGSAPNAGATAAVTHPVKQGLVQSLGVYFDTFLICSITAFIILVSRPDLATSERGIDLTQGAVVEGLGAWAGILLTLIIFLLAFSSILGNYYYGESNIEFISGKPMLLTGFRLLAILAVLGGSLASAGLVWTLADGIMGLMALVNLIAIALLSGVVMLLIRHYRKQRAAGQDPVFTVADVPVPGQVDFWQDRDQVTGTTTGPPQHRGGSKVVDEA